MKLTIWGTDHQLTKLKTRKTETKAERVSESGKAVKQGWITNNGEIVTSISRSPCKRETLPRTDVLEAGDLQAVMADRLVYLQVETVYQSSFRPDCVWKADFRQKASSITKTIMFMPTGIALVGMEIVDDGI